MNAYRWIKLALVGLTALALAGTAVQAVDSGQHRLTLVAAAATSAGVTLTHHMTWPKNGACGTVRSV